MTVFVGGELAVEAGLPAADELADELIDALVRARWAATELKRMTVTTNVDDLLEQAVADLGRAVRTVDVRAADPALKDDSVAVVKLRGTRQIHDGGHRRPADGACMTIDAIAAGGPTSPANQRVEER